MNNGSEEFSLSNMLSIFAKKWWIVLITLIVFGATAAVLSLYVMEPIYEADTTLYIGRDIDTQGAISYEDLLMGDRLANDYREFVKSRLVTGLVKEELGLDISTNDIAKKLNITSIQNTRVIRITVEDPDPNQAVLIADALANTFVGQVANIMKVENVQIIDVAQLPSDPTKPNVRMNIMISLLLGIFIGGALVLMIEYFDRTIKTSEDIKKQLSLPVIGIIPHFKKL